MLPNVSHTFTSQLTCHISRLKNSLYNNCSVHTEDKVSIKLRLTERKLLTSEQPEDIAVVTLPIQTQSGGQMSPNNPFERTSHHQLTSLKEYIRCVLIHISEYFSILSLSVDTRIEALNREEIASVSVSFLRCYKKSCYCKIDNNLDVGQLKLEPSSH